MKLGIFEKGNYKSRINGKNTVVYSKWKDMLKRCYDPKCSIYKWYGAKGVTVCKDWHYFQRFAQWYHNECIKLGIELNSPNIHLDKDINNNSTSKEYSPLNCILTTAHKNLEKAHAKHFKFVSPEGKEIDVYNLNQFCKENNLIQSSMSRVASGKYKQHKGWTLCS